MFQQLRLAKIFCLLSLVLISRLVWALPEDSQLPIHISAAQGQLNAKAGTSIFLGPVTVTQGSSTLISDKLTVYSDKHNKLIKLVAEGNPAHYQTLIKPQQPPFIATAQKITYFVAEARLLLQGNAKTRQGPNSYAAPEIRYYINEQTVVSPASPQGRTSIVIEPDSLSKS